MEKKSRGYRDHRNPPALSEAVARSMRGNKGKNTKPELVIRKALYKSGVRGYRLHWKTVPGRPDISFVKLKVAIFVNGCYWHRCPHCDLPLPKAHRSFWKSKFDTNKARDIKKSKELLDLGWRVHVLWECRVKGELSECLAEVRRLLDD